MKFTKHDTEIDSDGIMHEVIEQESDDGMFGMGVILTPPDIEITVALVNYCRLRYSEINGVPCTDPIPPGPDQCSDPESASMTGLEWQLTCEKEKIELVNKGLQKHSEMYNASCFKETFEVLSQALTIFHDSKAWDSRLNYILSNAVDVGNSYLKLCGVKTNQEIGYDWVIQQPIQLQND